jgi:hypothetical protein
MQDKVLKELESLNDKIKELNVILERKPRKQSEFPLNHAERGIYRLLMGLERVVMQLVDLTLSKLPRRW